MAAERLASTGSTEFRPKPPRAVASSRPTEPPRAIGLPVMTAGAA